MSTVIAPKRRKPPNVERALIPKTRSRTYWWYLVPGLAAVTAIIVVPLLWNIYLTFISYRGIKPSEWIGLVNWQKLFADDIFLQSFCNFIAMIVAMYVLTKLLGLVLCALLLFINCR